MRSILAFILFFYIGNIISQDNAHEFDRAYGPDALLYNGKKYSYFLPSGTGGHQFLSSSDYAKGEIVIRGRKFTDIYLNYDVYNQQLLLRFHDESGTGNIIEISKAWLESFHIREKDFKLLDFGSGPRFYQVLGEGPFFVLYYWHKELKLNATYGTTHYTFTPLKRASYVLTNGKPEPIRHKRNLFALMEPEKRPALKKYLKTHKVNLKKASDLTMTELINYMSNL